MKELCNVSGLRCFRFAFNAPLLFSSGRVYGVTASAHLYLPRYTLYVWVSRVGSALLHRVHCRTSYLKSIRLAADVFKDGRKWDTL